MKLLRGYTVGLLLLMISVISAGCCTMGPAPMILDKPKLDYGWQKGYELHFAGSEGEGWHKAECMTVKDKEKLRTYIIFLEGMCNTPLPPLILRGGGEAEGVMREGKLYPWERR